MTNLKITNISRPCPSFFRTIVQCETFLSSNAKASVLQQLGPNLTVQSVEFKILNSLIYEYAKVLASLCPFQSSSEPGAKEVFRLAFELFWNFFPAYQSMHDDGFKVIDGKHPVSFKTYVRGQLQRSFINVMRKKDKKLSEHGSRVAM